jgi:hypothetical protein
MAPGTVPLPLPTGSRIVIAAAVAIAASTALPPFCSMRKPACAACGCVVETTWRSNIGRRWVG